MARRVISPETFTIESGAMKGNHLNRSLPFGYNRSDITATMKGRFCVGQTQLLGVGGHTHARASGPGAFFREKMNEM